MGFHDAEAALQSLNDKPLKGRPCHLTWSSRAYGAENVGGPSRAAEILGSKQQQPQVHQAQDAVPNMRAAYAGASDQFVWDGKNTGDFGQRWYKSDRWRGDGCSYWDQEFHHYNNTFHPAGRRRPRGQANKLNRPFAHGRHS